MAKKLKPRLRIAPSLSLGLDAVTKTYAILAQRRKGKTYTANVMAEEMVRVGIPWVALDPTGAWWGLRAGKDGSSRGGLPVYVFGGQHGDLPLEETAGKVFADLVVDQPGHYILDVSEFPSKASQRRFATDFGDRLFHRKAQNRDVLHVFIDEADVFVPQKIPKGHEKMVGIYEEIVRRGGIRGLGTTMISQRSAIVNKNVLEQLDALIVLRVVGPRDQKAILEYVEAQGTDEEIADLKDTMATLKLGEAWFWEPGAEPSLFVKIQIRERSTFNSSATPDAGAKPSKAVKMKAVDLDALKGEIEATIEKAEEEDPGILHKRIRERDKEMARLVEELAEAEQIKVVEPVEVQVITPEVVAKLKEAMSPVEGMLQTIVDSLAKAGRPNPFVRDKAIKPARPKLTTNRKARDTPKADVDLPSDFKLGKATRALLTVLLQYPEGKDKRQLAVLSGYSMKSGSFNNSLSELRQAGLINRGTPIQATDLASEILTDVEPMPTGDDLFQYWLGKLGKPEREILTVLYESAGAGFNKIEIAEATPSQYSTTSGSFNNALSALRTRDLIEGRGDSIKAAEVLFS